MVSYSMGVSRTELSAFIDWFLPHTYVVTEKNTNNVLLRNVDLLWYS